jgi:hypothetical protein
MYERSWQLSNGRYGRAKRTLARLCFDRSVKLASCAHLLESRDTFVLSSALHNQHRLN